MKVEILKSVMCPGENTQLLLAGKCADLPAKLAKQYIDCGYAKAVAKAAPKAAAKES